MNWTRVMRQYRAPALNIGLAVLVLLLSACASTPAPEADGATAAQTRADDQARARLTSQFEEAVELKKSGDIGAAKARFQALAEANPTLTGPLANLALIAMEQGDPARAELLFQQVIALDPAHRQALNALGVLARQQGDFEQAETYYRQALAVDPRFQPALRNLAILLELYRGRLKEALALVERYQALQPEPDRSIKDWVFDLNNRIQAQAGES